MKDEKAESDVDTDEARVDSRGPDSDYVGRTAEDDPDDEESGAERRANN